MIIHSYTSSGGKDYILDYIRGLLRDEKIDGFSVLEELENDHLDSLVVKPWRGKVWEVYFRKHNRIFYITVDRQNVYLLHACKKQKNKTEKKDENVIIKRAKDLEKVLHKRFL
ncbi:type II toxin-antitoxin system RelE/ParE family toxin [Faecalicatena sp. AGMB00832]|uniref:Type II toxin-antitoxin system RelE/ParE family toxin n=1 Tax=Faecalicatena faecalis TaxID=2726362 RepID=A0ABS6D129_9FIRM|nr:MULTISPECIES: type II toxin-antitoxin system RelE/ParE family toxin [Faecalicatena]MBU3875297.1 type II toxin-antitoxin system RelE/ParE family toxin [Faecalicatena faecalis]MCI6467933.1 type II toxin-antitoxin system RelE/ParE family toxin [Faecalicatena sp.]MDY5619425.1 type II toxin-antitoxin system RelE/ParE family toxin [Lachnospiraceae bacterium]